MLDLELNYGQLEQEIKKMSKFEEKIKQAAEKLDKEIGERKLDERFSYIS